MNTTGQFDASSCSILSDEYNGTVCT